MDQDELSARYDSPIFGNVPPEHLPDKPGEWQVYEEHDTTERRIIFGCPKRPGYSCAVPLAPVTTPKGATWRFDGNREAPTLTPSINCTGGCGWHGHMTKGEFV